MSRVDRVVPWVVGAAIVAAVARPAWAQANLDAGKTPAQIFSNTCAACHRSPRELRPTSAGFLREHYSTGGREAAAMAAYLSSVGSDARAVQQRRPPALGAGAPAEAAARPPAGGDPKPTDAATSTDQAKPPAAAAARPRRPSDSIEIGKLPAAAAGGGAEAAPAQTAAVPASVPGTAEMFEE